MAKNLDIYIDQGATWNLALLVKTGCPAAPIDFTGYTGQAVIATAPGTTPVATIGVSFDDPATDGVINLTLSASQTSDIPANGATPFIVNMPTYYWELLITSPESVVTRLLQGKAFVSPELST